MEEVLYVIDKAYQVLSLLCHGKGGYSYLVTDGNLNYVLKQIHHEPCDYYTFGDKLATELADYEKLLATGIAIPILLEVDRDKERILKTYVAGPTIYELVAKDQMLQTYYDQIEKMAEQVKSFHLNIDYYPTNFVVQDSKLYYIDYECNSYMEEWSYEEWGKKYWSKTKEFMDTLKKVE